MVEEGCAREEMGRERRRSKVEEGRKVEGERLVAVDQEEGVRREMRGIWSAASRSMSYRTRLDLSSDRIWQHVGNFQFQSEGCTLQSFAAWLAVFLEPFLPRRWLW